MLLGGVLADLSGPPQAVAAAGGTGAACAAILTLTHQFLFRTPPTSFVDGR